MAIVTQDVASSGPTAQERRSGARQQDPKAKRLAIFIPTLAGGGVGTVILRLAPAFAERGYQVDLVVCRAEGSLADRVPEQVNLVELEREPDWRSRARVLAADWGGLLAILRPVLLARAPAPPIPYLGGFVRYLREARPDAVFAAKTHTNLVALWARRLAGVPTRIVVSERTHLSRDMKSPKFRKWRWRYVIPLVRRAYLWADQVIAVSNGVADDLAEIAAIPRGRITTCHNPVFTRELTEKAKAPVDHAWFEPGNPPVVLGVGRLVPQKDFPTLMRAFARVRENRQVRLMILGEGKEPGRRAELLELAERLGITDDLAMPGFVDNPYAYMTRSSIFALSSAWEGFANALAEAVACGCPSVSTDCPSGPAEILADGAYGRLVPVGDDAALAEAIEATLDNPPDRARLRRRGAEYSIESSVAKHLETIFDLGRQNGVV